MKRWSKYVLALAFALAAAPAHAQEPKDNKWTKDAGKFMGLVALKQTPEEKAPLYQQALTALQEGMQKEPSNAKIWMLAGQVYAGLDKYAEADEAFKKAQELYPEYGDEIEGEREQLWLKLFQSGVAKMDEQKQDEAIADMEFAERIYSKRPEALLNLGMLYNARGDNAKAQQSFEKAISVVNGDMTAQLPPETQAQWKSFEEMAKLSLAQMDAQSGIDLYQAQKYTEAVEAFRRALKANPYSRDYEYNMAQALYAFVGKLDEQYKAAKAGSEEQKKIAAQLAPLYDEMITVGQSLQKRDPNNPDVYLIQARAYRGKGELVADAKQKADFQAKSLEVLTANSNLPIELTDVQVVPGDGEGKFSGTVKTIKAKEGEQVKVHVSFVDLAGKEIGAQDILVAAPAANATAPLQGAAPVTGAIAGWKYEVLK